MDTGEHDTNSASRNGGFKQKLSSQSAAKRTGGDDAIKSQLSTNGAERPDVEPTG